MKDIGSKLITKTNLLIFNKEVSRLDDKMHLLSDTVELKLPAMEYKFDRELKNKGNREDIEKLQEEKADKEYVDAIVGRINKIEEFAAAQKEQENIEESEPEVVASVVENGEVKPESPRSPKKKKRSRLGDSDEEEAEERRKKFEETLKQLKDMQERLQT